MYLSHNIVNHIIELEQIAYCLQENHLENKNRGKLNRTNEGQILFFLVNEIGVQINLKDADKLVTEKKIVTKDFRGDLIENIKLALQLSKEIAQQKELELSIENLLNINQTIGGKIEESWKLNYRAAGEKFSKVFDDLTDLVDPNKQLQEGSNQTYGSAVNNLLEKYHQVNNANRFYKISRLIYELISLHPFIAYNKYTIIMIGHMLISKEIGYEHNFINLSELFTQHKTDIVNIFQEKQEETKIIKWHEAFLGFCAKQQSQAYNALKETQQSTPLSNKPFLDLNKRQLKILKYLQTIPTVKREDYVQMMDVSAMTAYRDLQVLLKHKMIRCFGTGRGTKYTLASR
jgi:hypothetical protein